MRIFIASTLAMLAAMTFVGWAAATHATDPYSGQFELVVKTSATQTVLVAQGGQLPPGGSVVISAAGPGFEISASCPSLPCSATGSGGLTGGQAEIETSSGRVVATATTGG